MISSPEDAVLLLKKWSSESADILAFMSPGDRGFIARVVGRITGIDDNLVCSLQSGEDFILFKLRDCQIGYGEDVEVLSTYKQAVHNDREKWKAALMLVYTAGASLVLCTME